MDITVHLEMKLI